MTLKLLLNLLFIVWGLSSAEEYTNHWLATEDIASVDFCSHDGYLKEGSCVCDTDYTGNFCLNRKCRNFGFDGRLGIDGRGAVGAVDRCICPPGFLGRNCEPVKCVDGNDMIYTSSSNEKTISLLASFNTPMQELWKTGDIGELVCNYTGYSRNFNYNYDNIGSSIASDTSSADCFDNVKLFLDPDTCKDDLGNPIACQQLNVANLNTLVQNSAPNSIVFVVTNMITSSIDSSLAEKIIGTAIAKRIQINVVVYNNTLPKLYGNDPSLTYLSNIATATFGTFVLPSIDSNNEQYKVVSTLLNLWANDIGVSTVFTNEVKNLPTDTSGDLYIAGQTYYSEDLTFNMNLPEIVIRTDFWKLYRIPANSFSPLLSISGQVDGTPVFVLSGNRIKAYSAFTSDDENDNVIDVSLSVSVEKASYPLVYRLESAGSVIQYENIRKTIGTPTSISISKPFNRIGCQFNLKFLATCNSVGASVITVVTTDTRSVSFPVYCASSDFAASIYKLAVHNNVELPLFAKRQSLAQDVTCSNSVSNEVVGKRSFVIIAENTKDNDVNKSSVDNVFRNKNSVFYQLGDFLNSANYLSTPIYTSYLAGLTNGETVTLPASNDYNKFLTKIMTSTNTTQSHTDATVNVTQILLETIEASNFYSDILFVINYNVTIDDVNPTPIKRALAVKRSKLFVTFVQTYVSISNDIYEYMNGLAVASGGVAVRLNDYTGLHTFFVQYFRLLVANDIVAKSYSENQKAGVALSNVSLTTDQYILLVTNEDLAGDGIVNATINVADIDVAFLPQIGELQIFTLTPKKAGTYNIPVAFSTSGLARMANVVLLANSANSDIVSLSFLDGDNKNSNDVSYGAGGYIPYFYSSSPFLPGSTVTVTYTDSQNPAKSVYSGSIINATNGCDGSSYQWTTNFKWICSISGGLYHFKVDRVAENGTISRTFPVTCLGDSSGDCLNGGQEEDGVCDCPLEWSGSKCEAPLCQNGGTKTDADTCSCLSAFTGDFCEISIVTCVATNSSYPQTPEYRSDLASLFIVADVQALKISNLSSGLAITGVPINVVLYGDGNDPRLVQSTTNGQHLTEVLGAPKDLTTPAPDTPNDMYKAINFALDKQFTSRSFVVVLTSNPDSDIDGDLLIRLAAKRAEIRVLSTSTADVSTNFATLSLVGNGIPYSISNDGFDKFMQSYIVPLFQSLQYTKNVPQRVFNVFRTGTFGNTPVTVTVRGDSTFDNAEAMAFVHVYKGNVKGRTDEKIVGSTRVYSEAFDPKKGLTLNIEENTVGVNGYFSVEVVSYLKTAYGFNNDIGGANEILNSGLISGQTNAITISPAPDATLPTSNPANFPYLIISEISNGTITNSNIVLFTRKSGTNCSFTYFSVLDVCSQASTIGYQVQLVTKSSQLEIRQQQFVLTCHKSSYKNSMSSCGGTGSPKQNGICDCDGGWIGMDCSFPICENGGVRDYSVCRCPLQYYGRRCQETYIGIPTTTGPAVSTTTGLPSTNSNAPSTQSTVESSTGSTTVATTTVATTTQAPEIRAAAFVIDVVGTDDYAFNQTTKAIMEYVRAFNNVHYVLLVGNWNSTTSLGFKQYASIDDLSNSLAIFWTIRKSTSDTKIASLSKALAAILSSYTKVGGSWSNLVSMNIFYDTQIELTDDPTNSMGGLETFTKSSVVFSPFAKNADQSVLDSLTKFSTDVSNVRDYYSGVKAMVSSTKRNDAAVLPTKPQYTCNYGMQNNINVVIDNSKPSSTAVTDNLSTFLLNFRNAYNYIENDLATVCSSGNLPNYWNEKTAFTAFAYYDKYVTPVSFCPSQYSSFFSFSVQADRPSADYTTKTVKYMARYINKNTCVCDRFTDDKTFKYIVWLPRTAAPLKATDDGTTDLATMLTLNTTNAYHFVVPFYDVTDKANDMYYQILVNQDTDKKKGADWYMLPNAATGDVNEIISTLNQKICEIADVDPTAIPPQLDSSIHFSSRHDDLYDELWN